MTVTIPLVAADGSTSTVTLPAPNVGSPSKFPAFTRGDGQGVNGFPGGYLTPLAVANAYQLPAGDGTGVTVGIVSLSGVFNVNVFNAYMQLNGVVPATVTVVNVDGSVLGGDGKDAELNLDVQTVAMLVPKANIRIYCAANTFPNYQTIIARATSECDVVSSSYTAGPSRPGNAADLAFAEQTELILRQGRARGTSFFCASDDWGSTSWPAECPSCISVGATQINMANVTEVNGMIFGTVASESVESFSGEGIGDTFSNVNIPTVACFGDPYEHGFPVAQSDWTWANYSSTSGATPFMAALHARLIQHRGKRFDFIDFMRASPHVFTTPAWEGITELTTTGILAANGTNGPKLLAAVDAFRPSIIATPATIAAARKLTFDTLGGGNFTKAVATSFSWPHNISGNAALIGFTAMPISGQTVVAPTAVTVGGVAATLLKQSGTTSLETYLYGLAKPPTGQQTVEVNLAAAGVVQGNSASYNNVAAFGAAVTNAGTTGAASLSVPSAPGDVAVALFTDYLTALTGFSGTARWNVAAPGFPSVFGDAPGAATVDFTAAGVPGWNGLGVNLISNANFAEGETQ